MDFPCDLIIRASLISLSVCCRGLAKLSQMRLCHKREYFLLWAIFYLFKQPALIRFSKLSSGYPLLFKRILKLGIIKRGA